MRIKSLFFGFSFVLITLQLFSQDISTRKANTIKDSLFRAISLRLSSMNIGKAENIPLFYIQLPDIGKNIDTLEKKATLNYTYPFEDTIFKFRTIQDLREKHLELKQAVGEKMSRIELVLHDAGLEYLSVHDTLKAKQLFRLSTGYNPAYSPAWYQLVKISITPSTILEAETYLTEALKKIDTASNPYYASLWRSSEHEVFKGFLAAALRQINKEDFFAALNLLERASFFCTSHPVPGCGDSLKHFYQMTKGGMFQSFIRIARRAVDNNRPEIAIDFINKAKTYFNENSMDILCGYLIKETSDYLLQKQAHYETNKARQYTRRTHDIAKNRRHKVKPQKGRSGGANSKRDRQIAAESKPIQLINDALVVQFVTKEVKDSVLTSIRHAYFLAWKNQIDSASYIYDYSKNNLKSVYLENDTEVVSVLGELKKRIDKQKCFNIESTYENYLNQAINLFNRSKFNESEEYLKLAAESYSNRRFCSLSDSLLRKLQDRYTIFYQYDAIHRRSEEDLLKGNFADFLKAYDESAILYQSLGGDKRKVQYTNIDTIIFRYNNIELTRTAFNRALKQENGHQMLKILEIMRTQAIRAKLCKMEQIQAAQFIAKIDYKKTGISAKENLEKYIIDKKWYKSFKNEYLRELKQLNNIK